MPAKRKNTPPKVHVATALEYAAQRVGLNHSDLADLCGVSKQAMSRRFDERKNISVGVAAQIAEAAGYELALIPQGSDYPPESLRIAPVLAEKHALGGRR